MTDFGVHHALDFLGNAVLGFEPGYSVGWSGPGLPVGFERQPYPGFIGRKRYCLPELSERRQCGTPFVMWIKSMKDIRKYRLSILIKNLDGLVEANNVGTRKLGTEERGEAKNGRFRCHANIIHEICEIVTK